MSGNGVLIESVSITAHYNDSSSVADSVTSVSTNGDAKVISLSLISGSWTFTAKGFDSDGYETCSGSTSATLSPGSQSLSIVLLEESGSVAVTATLPSAITSDFCVATAIRADGAAISGGFARDLAGTTLIGIPAGNWTVVVTGYDDGGNIYQGARAVTVANGATVSAAVSVSGTAVTPITVFVSNPASSLWDALWAARKSASTIYQPIQYRFASGTYALGDSGWNIPFAFYSGGWSNATTQGSSATTLTIPTNKKLWISASSPCGLDAMTIDGNGAWLPLQICLGSYALVNKVSVSNVASINPNNPASLGPMALLVCDGSAATVTHCAMAGGFNYDAPGYSPDHRLVLKDSSFAGGKSSVGYGDLVMTGCSYSWALGDGWDAATQGCKLIGCWYGKIVDIESSTLSISAGANAKAGSSVCGVMVTSPVAAQVVLKGNTLSFGSSGGESASLFAMVDWGIMPGSSIDIENNNLIGAAMPSQASASVEFLSLDPSTACSGRDDIYVNISGNTFDGTKKTNDGTCMKFISCLWEKDGIAPIPSTVDMFKDNCFKIASGGTFSQIIGSGSSGVDAYDAKVASLVNDASITTYLDSGTVSGNTVVAH
jgi:hypothetical protein